MEKRAAVLAVKNMLSMTVYPGKKFKVERSLNKTKKH